MSHSDRRRLRLADVTTSLDSRRRPVKGSERRHGPYPYYGASGVVDHVDSYLFEGLHLLVAEDGENLRSRRTPVAFLADGKFWVNNHAHVLQGNALGDTRYLKYALEQMDLSGYITGSTQPKLTKAALGSISLDLPPLHEQQKIAEVLGALDDKIAANATLIELLLATINTEFARWFGHRSLDVPLGALADVVDCLHSKKPGSLADGPTLMQLNNIRDDGLVDPAPTYSISPADYARWSSRFETRSWDLVITNVGRIGAVARIPNGYVAALGRNMTGVRPRDAAESGAFMVAALLSPAVRHEIDQRTDAGSVMSALNVRSIPLLRLQGSTSAERSSFHQFASPLLESADMYLSENATLAASRDGLLPHLLSGELSVRDAETAASAAGA